MSGQSGGINNPGTLNTSGGDAFAGNKTTTTHYHYSSQAKPRQLFRSTIPRLRNRFIGREDLLHEIDARLGDPSQGGVVVLRGQAGVGKSELACEFARKHLKKYLGGTFFIVADNQNLPFGLSRLEFPDFPERLPPEEQAIWTLQALGTAPTLLIYDNVTSEEFVQPWLPPAGMPCHVIVTTLLDRWDAGWLPLKVEPLSHERSLDLITDIAGSNLAIQYGQRLAETAGGLPVQLVSTSALLARQAQRGHGHVDAALFTLVAPKARGSFSLVYQELSTVARLLVHVAARLNPQRIPREELKLLLAEAVGWSEGEFQRHLDECLDLFVLQGESELRMHQLFARFVLDTQPSNDIAASLVDVGRVQADRALLETGVGFSNRGRYKDAIAVYDGLLARFGSDTEPPIREHVVRALLQKGGCLANLGHHKDAIAVYDNLLNRFGSDAGLPIREHVVRALLQKGGMLTNRGRRKDALAVYDDLLIRFGLDAKPPIREHVVKALLQKGGMLDFFGHRKDALAVYDDLIARFGHDAEPTICEYVSHAISYRNRPQDRSEFARSALGTEFGWSLGTQLTLALGTELSTYGAKSALSALGTLGRTVARNWWKP